MVVIVRFLVRVGITRRMIVTIIAMAAVIMITMVGGWKLNGMSGMRFEETDTPGETHACQESRGQFRAIMGMKLNFRQNV